jgi:hypothetical protein
MDAGDGRNSISMEAEAGGLIDYWLLFKYTIILLAGIIIGKVFL